MPTIYTDPAHLKTVQDFADRTSQREALDTQLTYLEGMTRNRDGLQDDLYIHSDFAPMSFYFEIFPAGSKRDLTKRLWNGGLIYHGKLENGSKPETFSVELTPSNSWSIHT
jgi:hypothetical protein